MAKIRIISKLAKKSIDFFELYYKKRRKEGWVNAVTGMRSGTKATGRRAELGRSALWDAFLKRMSLPLHNNERSPGSLLNQGFFFALRLL